MVKRMLTTLNDHQMDRGASDGVRRPARVHLIAGVTTGLAVALWASVASPLVRVVATEWRSAPGTGPRAPEDLLTLAAAVLALALLGWLALGALIEVVARAPGRVGAVASRTAARLTPAATRRLVGFALGVGLAAVAAPPAGAWGRVPGPASPATGALARAGSASGSADPVGPDRAPDPGFAPTAPRPVSTAPAPGWTPAAPVVRPQPSTDLLTRAPRIVAADDAVVVHRGDTLWSIAARRLGAGASDAEIAADWPRWYAANRHVIGPDPDLILPGQRLRVPAGGRVP